MGAACAPPNPRSDAVSPPRCCRPANFFGSSRNAHDVAAPTLAFDQWCTDNIAPWFDDHVAWDADLARRWAGGDVDLSRPLPSDLIVAATAADPSLFPLVGPYLGMRALPASLDAVQARVREIYAGGWRPPVPDGPTRDELAELVAAHAPAGRH